MLAAQLEGKNPRQPDPNMCYPCASDLYNMLAAQHEEKTPGSRIQATVLAGTHDIIK